jgi:hypothetical protein
MNKLEALQWVRLEVLLIKDQVWNGGNSIEEEECTLDVAFTDELKFVVGHCSLEEVEDDLNQVYRVNDILDGD